MKNKDLKKFYDSVYKKGEKKHWTKLLFAGKNQLPEEEQEVLKEINWNNKKVLDAGCGTGLLAYLIAKKGALVTGVDYALEAIKIAKSSHRHPNLNFLCCDFSDIKEKYDVIISVGTLEHTDNPFEVLKKLKSKLNKSGRLIITCPNWLNPYGYILLTLRYLFSAPITLADIHYLTPLEFNQWAERLGMKLSWRTFDHSWASGEKMIVDFNRRLPNVFRDMKMFKNKQIKEFIGWLESHVVKFDHKREFSGATGLYHLS